jgi:hypothetical protein
MEKTTQEKEIEQKIKTDSRLMKEKITFIDFWYWRILKRSFIFRYWYQVFLTKLVMDLENGDIEYRENLEKYRNKLNKFKES